MAPRKTREEWIAGAFELLCDGGIDALRVEPLARHMGVTKGSFYHHFADRRDLHMALLAEWERLGTSVIIAGVEAGATDPVERLRQLMDVVFRADPVVDSVEAAIRGWATVDAEATAVAERVDARRVRFVTQLLVDAGLGKAPARRRALIMYRNLIGEYTWRSSGGPASTRKEVAELADLLLADL